MDNILFDITPNFKTILCALSRKLSIKRVQFVYETHKLDIFLFSTLLLHLIHNQFHSDDNNDGQILKHPNSPDERSSSRKSVGLH